jgi:MtN3 and saliva related transmembrane protein
MWALLLVGGLRQYTEAIGFWAAILTTVAFAPQVIHAWRTGAEGLSWLMLALFGAGVGLWFLYGLMRMSAPIITGNAVTGLQILILVGLKIRRVSSRKFGGKL